MKRYIIFFLGAIFLTNCKKDALNLTPISTATTETFYKTSNDMVNAINATYAVLQSNAAAGTEFMFGDLATDDTRAVSGLCAAGHCDFDVFSSRPVGSSNAIVLSNRWNDAYKGISRANTLLDRIGEIPMDEDLRSRIIGEAKFLRAYFYFNLVKVFGDVPIVLKELKTPDEAYEFGRRPKSEVFLQIEKDLTEAAAILPPSYAAADLGRATKWAATGILARVLLFQKKYTEAIPLLEFIVAQNSGTFDLLANYEDVFKYNNGNNKEIVFAVQYTGGEIGEGNSPTNNFPLPPVVPYNSQNVNQPTIDIYNAYETGDLRRDASIGIIVKGGVDVLYVKKFLDPSIVTADSGTDYPILRYSDVLLMYAEALNEASESGYQQALSHINRVRQRAFGNSNRNLQTTNAAAADTYVGNQADMRNRILNERRTELAFEGLRFFDLVRTDRLVPVMNAYFTQYNITVNGAVLEIGPNNRLFPIPQAQINVNPEKMEQNPGYN